jgi:HNH endonuclease
MPFSPSLALRVRQKCHFQCCLCRDIGVEIHHIVPQSEGGSDTEENAAPLCPSCHEKLGANPTKRKFIREARDFWFETCAARYASDASKLEVIQTKLTNIATKDDIKELGAKVTDILNAFSSTSHSRASPLPITTEGRSRVIGIRDLLVLVHAGSSDRPASQVEVLCIRQLWPVGKDGWRDIYKTFVARFGELTLRHLASRALDLEGVPRLNGIAEDDLLRAHTTMRVEAMCMVLLDSRHIGAVMSATGEVMWTAAPVDDEP